MGDEPLFHYTTDVGLQGALDDEALYSPSFYRKNGIRKSSHDYGDWGCSTWFTSCDFWEPEAGFQISKLIIWPDPETVPRARRISIMRSTCEWLYVSAVRYPLVCGEVRRAQHFATLQSIPISKWISVGEFNHVNRTWRDVPIAQVCEELEAAKNRKWNRLPDWMKEGLAKHRKAGGWCTLGRIRELVESFERAKARNAESKAA